MSRKNYEKKRRVLPAGFRPVRGCLCGSLHRNIMNIPRLSLGMTFNEEERIHVHIECEDGEAKFWIEPIVSLAAYYGLNKKKLNEIQKIVETRKDEITKEWKRHFSKR